MVASPLILLAFIGLVRGSAYLGCLDDEGEPIDRWSSIKNPSTGNYYVYESSSSSFVKSEYTTSQTQDGMIMKTMNQLYSGGMNFSEVIYAMYNDEPPPDSSASSGYAHAKGVIVVNEKQGFWLVHSMPKWPNQIEFGAAPFPDETYAQTLECITISGNTANNIANGLMVSRPYIYDRGVGSTLDGVYPTLQDWVEGDQSSDMTYTAEFKSWDGAVYTQLEKNRKWQEDFWDDLVAPYFKAPLNVETWRSGSGGRMGSICADGENEPKQNLYDVMEISTIMMGDGQTWGGTKDHSKWAATGDSSTYVTCIGDLNRMCSQEGRGGGGVCRKEDNRWRAFNNIIDTMENCWEYNPCDTTYDSCYWCPQSALKMDGLSLGDASKE